MPALPLGDAGPYVAAAYLVFLALILIYVGIMASKLARIERQTAELNELAARRLGGGDRAATATGVDPAEPPTAGDERATLPQPDDRRGPTANGGGGPLRAGDRVESP